MEPGSCGRGETETDGEVDVRQPQPQHPLIHETERAEDGYEELSAPVEDGDIFSRQAKFPEPEAIFSWCGETQKDVDLSDFVPDNHLPQLKLPDIRFPSGNIETSIGSLELLHRTYRDIERQDAEVERLASEACGLLPRKMRKMELPVLRTDNEMDCAELSRSVESSRQVDLVNHGLPEEPADVEKDEALEFPSSAHRCAEDVAVRLLNEAIDVSRDAMRCLISNLSASWTAEDQRLLLESDLARNEITRPWEPLTPPLSPIVARSNEPFVPDTSACRIPAPSDLGYDVASELKEVEARLFEADAIPTACLPELEGLRSPGGIEISGLLSDNEHTRGQLSDLKMEEPLLPLSIEHPEPSIIKADVTSMVASISPDRKSSSDAIREADDSFQESIEQHASAAERSIQQEKIDTLNTISRLPLPLMDFSVPGPDWSSVQHDAALMFGRIKQDLPRGWHPPCWPKDRKAETHMRWIPLTTEVGKIAPDMIEFDPAVLHSLVTAVPDHEVLTSEDCVCKPKALAILCDDEDEDEDELEPADGSKCPSSNLMVSVRKRKRQIIAEEGDKTSEAGQGAGSRPRKSRTRRAEDCMLFHEDGKTAETLLNNYMFIHAPKKVKVASSPYFIGNQASTKTNLQKDIQTTRDPIPEVMSKAPCPSFKTLSRPTKVIISLDLARHVVRSLEELLPTIEFVERDFNAHNSSEWLPGTVRRSQVTSPLAFEADLAVSPAAGIIITTMVRLRQRPSPGKGGLSAIQIRVKEVSKRYERLIILVSQGSKEEVIMGDMSTSDATALAEFQGFLHCLEATTAMYYVSGGEETLAKWVAKLICRHAAEPEAVQHTVLDEETPWELFLRRAGLNTYAAQVVAADCKAETGLAGFVSMPVQERIRRYGHILGGERVLMRVGRAIGSIW